MALIVVCGVGSGTTVVTLGVGAMVDTMVTITGADVVEEAVSPPVTETVGRTVMTNVVEGVAVLGGTMVGEIVPTDDEGTEVAVIDVAVGTVDAAALSLSISALVGAWVSVASPRQ